MISTPCIEVQTTSENRFSVPAWFAEVVIMARYLEKKGLLEAFAHQVRLVRGRFGRYEPIDFLAVLIGYAISGERTLADFFERVEPFETAFMALFGRRCLPHRSSLSRFLADVDRPCLEAVRTLFEQHTFTEGWTSETIGGVFDRQGHRYMVFDVDATRQAARQRALPCDPALPAAKRRRGCRLCAWLPGAQAWGSGPHAHHGASDAHAPMGRDVCGQGQWRLSRGTGFGAASHHRLFEALRISTRNGPDPSRRSLRRYDRRRSTAPGRHTFRDTMERIFAPGASPDESRVLAHAPTASMARMNSGVVVELFEGGWLELGEDLSAVRVIVARHPAPPPGKNIPVGKRVGEWVYELFITMLDAEGFLVEDVLDLYHGRGAFEAVLADEDVEEDPDRWCSYTECGQELWQIACQWVWNLRLSLGQTMQGTERRDTLVGPSQRISSCLRH